MIKKINYFEIIKKALVITKENKFLWWFGFLITLGGGMSLNYNFPSSFKSDKEFDEMAFASMLRKVSFYWENYKEWIIAGIAFLIFVLMVFYLLSLLGRSSLIYSVLSIIKGDRVGFKSGIKNGSSYFIGMIFLSLSVSFSFLILIGILFFPIVRLFMLEAYGAAFLMGFVAILILFSFSIFAYFMKKYAEVYLVSSLVNPISALKLAYSLLEKNLGNTFLMGLICVGIGFVFGIGLVVILIGIVLPTTIIGFLIYKIIGEIGFIILSIFGFFFLFILILFFNSVYNVFFESIWILFFREIAKGEDNQEKETATDKNVLNIPERESVGINNI